jgi:hypothetical protein
MDNLPSPPKKNKKPLTMRYKNQHYTLIPQKHLYSPQHKIPNKVESFDKFKFPQLQTHLNSENRVRLPLH